MAYVTRSMQFANAPAHAGVEPTESSFPHIFVVGDCADAFGALNAGHTAWAQGGLAAQNILRLIKNSEGANEKLEHYQAPMPAIKVSLGLVRS
jgi:NADH dehydrogenase FAD-containing subunit